MGTFAGILCGWLFPFACTQLVALDVRISLFFIDMEFLMPYVVGDTLGILGSALSHPHFFRDDWFLFHSHTLFTQGYPDFLVTPYLTCGLLLSRDWDVLHDQFFSRNRHFHSTLFGNYFFPQADFPALDAFFIRPQDFSPELNPVIFRCRAHASAASGGNLLKSAFTQLSTR